MQLQEKNVQNFKIHTRVAILYMEHEHVQIKL